MSATIKGYEAIEYAEQNGLALSKYADPTEAARTGLSADEAREVAAQDPSLIYVATYRCECGETSGERCEWTGPAAEMVTLEWMPPQHRESHTEVGNRGVWPRNGALRLRVERSCAERVIEYDGEWAAVVIESVESATVMAEAEKHGLTAEVVSETMTVSDGDASRWWPSEEAEAEIDAADDREMAALRICVTANWRGKWVSN